jgi:hypothetical protein
MKDISCHENIFLTQKKSQTVDHFILTVYYGDEAHT